MLEFIHEEVVMGFLRLMLLTAVLAGCHTNHCNADAALTCGGSTVCAYVHVDGDRLFLGVINDSEDLVYVPWINGATSLVSGFVLKKVAQKNSKANTGGPIPTAIPFVGDALLVPHSSYGVSISGEDAKELFQLKNGCQTVVAEFRALASDGNHRDKLVTSAASKPTEICL